MMHRLFTGFGLFGKAYRATHHEIWASLKVLAIITIVFAIAMFLAERSSNPDFSFWDALVWTFVKYVEDPADITEAPVTMIGKIIGTLVGVLGIAIFAVPAGLIGSGMMDAMSEDKREEELATHGTHVPSLLKSSFDKGKHLPKECEVLCQELHTGCLIFTAFVFSNLKLLPP